MKHRFDYRIGSFLSGLIGDQITRAFLKRDIVLAFRHSPAFVSGLIMLGMVTLINILTEGTNGLLIVLYYVPAFFAYSYLSGSLQREGSSLDVAFLLMEKEKLLRSKFLGTFLVVCGLSWLATLIISFTSPILQVSLTVIVFRLILLFFASCLGTLLALAFTARTMVTGKAPFNDLLAVIVLGLLAATVFFLLDYFLIGEVNYREVVYPVMFYGLGPLIIIGVSAICVFKLKKCSQELAG